MMKIKALFLLLLALTLSVTLMACNEPEVCNHKWDMGVVKTEPTCLTDGVRVVTCLVCEKTQEVVEPAVGQHVWDDGEQTKEPTCGVDGVMTYHCTSCDATDTKAVAATGMHTMSEEVTVLTAPTCGATGTRSRTCLTCGYERTYVTPSTGDHVPDDTPVAAEAAHYTPCAVCGKSLGEEAHTWDDGTVILEPDGCKAGIKEASCKVCGQTSQVSVASNKAHTASAALDKENSTVTYTCSVCEDTYTYDVKFLYDFDDSTVPLSLVAGNGTSINKDTDIATWVKKGNGNGYQVLVRNGASTTNSAQYQAQNNSGLVTSSAADAVLSFDIMGVDKTNSGAKFMFSFYNSSGSWTDNSRGIQFFQIVGNDICVGNTTTSIGTANTNGWVNIRMEIQMVNDTFVVKYFVDNKYKASRTFSNTLLNDSYNVLYLNTNISNQDTGYYFDNLFFGSK